mgnify:CR=1 FL=1
MGEQELFPLPSLCKGGCRAKRGGRVVKVGVTHNDNSSTFPPNAFFQGSFVSLRPSFPHTMQNGHLSPHPRRLRRIYGRKTRHRQKPQWPRPLRLPHGRGKASRHRRLCRSRARVGDGAPRARTLKAIRFLRQRVVCSARRSRRRPSRAAGYRKRPPVPPRSAALPQRRR